MRLRHEWHEDHRQTCNDPEDVHPHAINSLFLPLLGRANTAHLERVINETAIAAHEEFMSDRPEQAAMAKSAEATTTARAPRATPTTSAGAEGDARTLPLNDFLTVPEHRLRDLLAYGMAAEAGHTLPREGVDGLRRAADAELEAHAFRLMHNQAETIRRQAMDEQLARLPRGLSFTGVVAANIVAVALGLALLLAASLAFPDWVASLAEQAAQFLARATIRS